METILGSVKGYLGIKDPDYVVFDADILMNINSALTRLYQLGVDSAKNLHIDRLDTWDDTFFDDIDLVEMIKQYVYLDVRRMFDPPSNSSVATSIDRQISELEWRIQIQAEGYFEE